MRVVGIGGGTGLPVLLRGLRELASDHIDVTAIVTTSDSGGSSGALRRAFNIPAVGDIRNCLVALARPESLLTVVCGHRFNGAAELDGHNVGNLIISALYQMAGDLPAAVRMASGLLEVQGEVLPCTAVPTTLYAEYEDGAVVGGEAEIPSRNSRIQRVWVEPQSPMPCPGVLDAISKADIIVLGPGSLYTSVIPNLLIGGVAEAIRRSPAVRIYACNLMTEPGETRGYSAAEHLRVVQTHLHGAPIDACIFNTAGLGTLLAERYSRSGAEMVQVSEEEIRRMNVEPVGVPLLDLDATKVRHRSRALAEAIVSVANEFRNVRQNAEPARLLA